MAKKRKTKQTKKVEEEVVDYAAAADSFAGNAADDSESEEVVQESADSSDEDGNEQVQNIDDDDDVVVDDDGDDDDSDESHDEEADDKEGGENEDEDTDGNEQEELDVPHDFEQPKSATGEPCTFDLRNLMAMNAHQINTKELYSTTKGRTESVTIPAMQVLANLSVDEEQLLEKATDGCAQLIATLWQLPKERSSAGPMVHLPSTDESRIPRALVCSSDVGFFVAYLFQDLDLTLPSALAASTGTQSRNKVGEVCP